MRHHGRLRLRRPRRWLRRLGTHRTQLRQPYVKPVLLELGRKNPIIVLDDADVNQAAEQAAFARFMNSGQICLSVDRIIVDRSIAARFTEKFLEHVAAFAKNGPDSPDAIIGPVIHARAAARVGSAGTL